MLGLLPDQGQLLLVEEVLVVVRQALDPQVAAHEQLLGGLNQPALDIPNFEFIFESDYLL